MKNNTFRAVATRLRELIVKKRLPDTGVGWRSTRRRRAEVSPELRELREVLRKERIGTHAGNIQQ